MALMEPFLNWPRPKISALCTLARLRMVPFGTYLTQPGAQANTCFFMLSGTVKIYKYATVADKNSVNEPVHIHSGMAHIHKPSQKIAVEVESLTGRRWIGEDMILFPSKSCIGHGRNYAALVTSLDAEMYEVHRRHIPFILSVPNAREKLLEMYDTNQKRWNVHLHTRQTLLLPQERKNNKILVPRKPTVPRKQQQQIISRRTLSQSMKASFTKSHTLAHVCSLGGRNLSHNIQVKVNKLIPKFIEPVEDIRDVFLRGQVSNLCRKTGVPIQWKPCVGLSSCDNAVEKAAFLEELSGEKESKEKVPTVIQRLDKRIQDKVDFIRNVPGSTRQRRIGRNKLRKMSMEAASNISGRSYVHKFDYH